MASWNKGDRVVQAIYGSGTVLEANDQHTVIHFDTGGRRKFSTNLVVLEPSGEAPKPLPMISLPAMPRGSGPTSAGNTTMVGYENHNRQIVVRSTNLSGNLPGQRVYVLRCGKCGHHYGANGCDAHLRRCPACMGGQPGLEY